MRALVTGARGFTGRHLAAHLAAMGVEVRGLLRLPDVSDEEALAGILREARPDAVFHLAGVPPESPPELLDRVHVRYAGALLAALQRADLAEVPVLVVGSAAEYGIPERLPVDEDAPARPRTAHGESKLAQTRLALEAASRGRRVVVARTFNLAGPRMPRHLAMGSFVAQLREAARGAAPPVVRVGNLEARRDFVDVRDAVRCYVDLLAQPRAWGQVVNVCRGSSIAMREVLERLIHLSGVEVRVERDPARDRAVDVPDIYGDTTRLEGLIGGVSWRGLDQSLSDAWNAEAAT